MIRAVLVYRSTCAKCRVLSLIAALLGLGSIRRVRLETEEGRLLADSFGAAGRPKVTLVVGGRRLRGGAVLFGVPFAPVATLAALLKRFLDAPAPTHGDVAVTQRR